MATYLDRILASHRAAAAVDPRSVDSLIDRLPGCPAVRGFRAGLAAVAATGELAVISEVKRRSPSRGDLHAGLDPAALAAQYEGGGAAALSVLTDQEYFGGSPDDLRIARSATALPALRKDFTVGPHDVLDTRLMGADAVLLIAAALDASELDDLYTLATEVGLDVLVEVHDEAELERALAIGATLVGVNQRDLTTFKVDTDRAVRMAPQMPDGIVRVAESGVGGPDDAARLADAGYHAVLVGESLVTAGDPGSAVRAMRRAPIDRRASRELL
jgi:indole-3-glycerol phosphate synthase